MEECYLQFGEGMTETIFDQVKYVHMTGIKGVAMTALAQCLVDLGISVEGSDIEEEFVTQEILNTLHIPVKIGFHESNVSDQTQLLVYTAAHSGSKNVEVTEALRRGIPTLSHGEALGKLMEGKKGISVCGVGGKSTTTAMITWILEKTGRSPSYAIGVGGIPGLRSSGRYEKNSDLFVAEADEYATDPGVDNTPRFLHQHPTHIVCTNILHDHPDIYASLEETKQAYLQFFSQLPEAGVLVVNGDDPVLDEVVEATVKNHQSIRIISVGKREKATIMCGAFSAELGKTTQECTYNGQEHILTLLVPGEFNAKNALYALAVTTDLGVPIEEAITVLAEFRGTKRRFENMGKKDGIQFYDDYAHHPTEIQATLKALREWYPGKRVVAIFQPHTYSRTKSLLNEFSRSFHDANQVYLLDIFASARELADATISSEILAQKLTEQHVKAENLHTIQEVVTRIKATPDTADVVITIGAGDLYHLHELW